ncbi:hypothetical protein ElyMa_004892500 [Elysia marginata]|uniref:Coiled-coil domain-containing protein 52 n=1 Tax=Elysia marginata TaxID=1093978 RepID=A0AAV4ITC4_9GAST|nr:hypothetical protein ElyMa_004892500 [Elysia marginata]
MPEPLVIRAMDHPVIGNFASLAVHSDLPQVDSATVADSLVDTEEKEALVQHKVLNLENVEEKESSAPQVLRTESAPSAALVNLLTQQMNDVIFKLQTLTSRITLVENRVTMVEAQLKDEKSHRMTLFASQSYTQAKKAIEDRPVGLNVENRTDSMRQSGPAQYYKSNSENRSKSQGRMTPRQKDKLHETGENYSLPPNKHSGPDESHRGHSKSSKEKVADSKDHCGNGEINADYLEMPVKSSNLAFMKSLVHPADCSSLLTTSGAEPPESLTATETQNTTQQNESTLVEHTGGLAEETNEGVCDQLSVAHHSERKDTHTSSPPVQQQPQPKSSKPGQTKTHLPFSQDFSPIRPFSDLSSLCLNQDESASLVFPSTGHMCDELSAVGRRSSTPTGLSEELDTSTLDRIGRINQMMEATKQLLH